VTGSPLDIDGLDLEDLKQLIFRLLEENVVLREDNVALREEVARLKGLKGRPRIKPSGMDKATQANTTRAGVKTGRRGAKRLVIDTEQVIAASVPPRSRFKGYEEYVVQELILRPHVTRFRRERWRTPDGATVVAPLPPGIVGHFGPELRRYVLALYHRGQVTMPRLVAQLNDLGIDISKRQVVRLLNAGKEDFLGEAGAVLRAGLETASWITVDDTGARHRGSNGVCTQIGNDHFAWFATTSSKSRLNFLALLRADHEDYVINDAAVAYMHGHNLTAPVVALLAGHQTRRFADEAAWRAHLDGLAITALKVQPDPVRIATEGALWGSVTDHGLLADAVVISDDAGQFNVGYHALCWVHAERLIHKLTGFTENQRAALERIRARVWWFYADLKTYCRDPTPAGKRALSRRFDRIFATRTEYATLDRLLDRLRANKDELLVALERPDIPLHTNASENDIRCQSLPPTRSGVTRRKISAGTRSDAGRNCRDGFLGLMKTCDKLDVGFWNYLGSRLNVPEAPTVPPLPQLIRQRAAA